jgi:hypothetical protein
MSTNKILCVAQENGIVSAILDGIDDLTNDLAELQFHAVSSDRLRPDTRVVAVLELHRLMLDLQRVSERARQRLIDHSMGNTIV